MRILPTLDSPALAAANRAALDVPRDAATALGHSASAIFHAGYYQNRAGELVDIRAAVDNARATKTSLPPDAQLPERETPLHPSIAPLIVPRARNSGEKWRKNSSNPVSARSTPPVGVSPVLKCWMKIS